MKLCFPAVLLWTLTLITVFGVYFWSSCLVFRSCIAEAGTVVEAADFARDEDWDIDFAGDEQRFDTAVPGEYPVRLRCGVIPLVSSLIIQDSIPPSARVLEKLSIKPGEDVKAEDFVEEVTDATATSIRFDRQPDIDHFGVQELSILITDLGGNSSDFTVSLVISPLKEELICEAGDEHPAISDFMCSGNAENLELVTDIGTIDMDRPGEYKIVFRDNGELFISKLRIQDTTAPVLEVKDVAGYCKHPVKAEDFVVEVRDVTEVTLAIQPEPDITKPGTREIEITATDAAGNKTSKKAKLVLTEDNEPPQIKGVRNKTIFAGDAVSYREGITVSDNSGTSIELDIDTGEASNRTPGQYVITYTATDPAGNTTTQTATLTVMAISYDQETINAMADNVLGKIIKPGMGPREKLDAIYDWVRGNVGYVTHSDKISWQQGAFEGFKNHKGDCWVFYSTTKALLTRAGISNIDIQKMSGFKSMHYWSLVDIGEGWYHYDTCPRASGGRFCYISDAELMAYSEAHGNSHIYDRSLYPEIK